MIRNSGRTALAACAFLCGTIAPAGAQAWNDERTRSLVQLATERRARQLADSGLVDYQARAHGYLTFLAQLGEGFQEPPRVVKADELVLEVYWRSPNLSKQRIIGRRDTTLLPTDISYHRDHLGIIQNNFPAIIRLGDGDEVRDVPHPLSPTGLGEYDFAIADSLRMSMPGRTIAMYEVKVRPRDDRQPRVIGALYLDRDNGQVVRMALSFTRAAFKDRQLEDLFVVLENGLVGATYWLPRRQEIEIRRSATWMDYPIRGIIRGRWEIRDYELNVGIPPGTFVGPEIVSAPGATRYPWPGGRILDSLPPDIRAVTADEVRRVQAEVRALVREQALQRQRRSALAGSGISDFARFNRVEGLAVGAGLSFRLGRGVAITGRGRYGLADERAKAHATLSWQRASGRGLALSWSDDFRDVGDVPERSGVANSLAAQEFASDHTDPYRVRAVTGSGTATLLGLGWTVSAARESHAPLEIHAVPARGSFRPTPPAEPVTAMRYTLRAAQPTRLWLLGTEARGLAEVRTTVTDSTTVHRAGLVAEIERPLGGSRIASRTIAATIWSADRLLGQELVFLGGPVSIPGYTARSLVGRSAVAQRVELQLPVPFPSFRLGTFGRSAARAMLAPHATIAWLRGLGTAPTWPETGILDPVTRSPGGTHRSLGASLLFGFDLLRVDVSRGVDAGGRWTFSLDVNRAFWGVL